MESREFFLGKTLKQLQQPFEKTLNRNLQKFDLTWVQLQILKFIASCGEEEVNQVDIENYLRCKNPTVTGLLKRLEEKGFLKRVASQKDKRYKAIVLTRKGWELPPQAFQDMEELEKRFMGYLEMEEQEQLKGLLLKLLNCIQEEQDI